ncbi:MAG: hydrogenase maturation protease [bacterium]|nr:hydrogenase maturation protease [bacterium]
MVLVIAYGNQLRRDDGAGPELAAEAQRTLQTSAVRWMCVQQLTPELAVEIGQARAVIFLDASVGEEPPGTVFLRQVNGEAVFAGGHFMSPAALMACVGLFSADPPPAWVLTVAGLDFGHGRGLSEPVRRGMTDARQKLKALLAELNNEVVF